MLAIFIVLYVQTSTGLSQAHLKPGPIINTVCDITK